MIVITGAAGFIGSCLAGYLHSQGKHELVLVDEFSRADKQPNYSKKPFQALVDRTRLFDWLDKEGAGVRYVIHLGARTDTTEQSQEIFQQLNLSYSQRVWTWCVRQEVPLIYASSAATYGDGSLGFDDDHALVPSLQPLNPYGQSKQAFDAWVLQKSSSPPSWCGLKFFNVYGPNEYHKGRMASVIFHAYHQIQQTGQMRLFRSHRSDYKDGEQLRDFVYVMDVVRVIDWLMEQAPQHQIFNLGTGIARTFNDLVGAIFATLNLPPNITYIDIPTDIRNTYQYYTAAKMDKLIQAGYPAQMTTLEAGIEDYVRSFLQRNIFY